VGIQPLFGLSVLMSFVAFALVTKLYIWPRLETLERDEALVPLLLPHTFRFIGLSFLVPGVVSPSLPSAFAAPAAYGDLAAAILAVVATVALSMRTSLAIFLVWLFNVWGAADLLFAFYQALFGVQLDARMLGAAFFIPTAIVPPLLIIHGLIFWLLLRPKQFRDKVPANNRMITVHSARGLTQESNMFRRIPWQDVCKFLAGAFFVNAGILFYLYLARVSVPLLGSSFVETPEISGMRSIVHAILFLTFFYLGFIREWKTPFARLNGDDQLRFLRACAGRESAETWPRTIY